MGLIRSDKEMIVMSYDHAESLKPILRWVKADGPRKQERDLAAALLRDLDGIEKDKWKQIMVSKKEKELLFTVNQAFPGGAAPDKGRQMSFFKDMGPEIVLGMEKKSKRD